MKGFEHWYSVTEKTPPKRQRTTCSLRELVWLRRTAKTMTRVRNRILRGPFRLETFPWLERGSFYSSKSKRSKRLSRWFWLWFKESWALDILCLCKALKMICTPPFWTPYCTGAIRRASSVTTIWELTRKADSQAPPQTFWTRIYILTRSRSLTELRCMRKLDKHFL